MDKHDNLSPRNNLSPHMSVFSNNIVHVYLLEYVSFHPLLGAILLVWNHKVTGPFMTNDPTGARLPQK